MKYNFCDLIFEVGRGCNMQCPHCLRGDAQPVSMYFDIIDKVLDHTESICSLVLTGGEPFLYPEQIHHIVTEIRNRNIQISSFFIATNGTVQNMSVLHDLMDLYALCDDKDICSMKISNDKYHDHTKTGYWPILDALRFSYLPGDTDDKDEYLIHEGRAAKNYPTSYRKPNDDLPSFDDSVTGDPATILEGLVYVSTLGDILTCCDLSYQNQPIHSHGNLKHSSFDDIMHSIHEKSINEQQ